MEDKPVEGEADKPKEESEGNVEKPKEGSEGAEGKPAEGEADKPKEESEGNVDKPKEGSEGAEDKPAEGEADKPKEESEGNVDKPKEGSEGAEDKPVEGEADKPKEESEGNVEKPKEGSEGAEDKPVEGEADKPKEESEGNVDKPKDGFERAEDKPVEGKADKPKEESEGNADRPKEGSEGAEDKPVEGDADKPKEGSDSREDKPSNEGENKKSGFFGKLSDFFHRGRQPEMREEEAPESPKRGNWDGMETAPAPNGSGWTILPGNYFDEYSDIDKNYGDHPRTSIPKEEQEFRTVNPADIEGVHLGESDIEDPSRFWDMHNGSKEDWMDTASHIPEVQSRLYNGEPLQSLLDDDRLGRCAQAYFNPDSSKAIEVDEMPGGGYMFNGDGRHRIIAARSFGYDIPVKVIGRYD